MDRCVWDLHAKLSSSHLHFQDSLETDVEPLDRNKAEHPLIIELPSIIFRISVQYQYVELLQFKVVAVHIESRLEI